MKYFTVLFLMVPFMIFAQTRESVSVFFDLDERHAFDKAPLDEFLKNAQDIDRVEIIGFADFLGSSNYNQKLSADRARSVQKYLGTKASNLKITSVTGKGELPTKASMSDDGVPKDRRVDVVFYTSDKQKVGDPKPKVISQVFDSPEPDAMEIDTTKEANIVLDGVGFIPGRHYPLPESKPKLDALLGAMKKYKTLNIEIQGFICCDYSNYDGMDNDTQTMNLSENRAKFIYDFLIREGISEDRLSYKGYGSSRPKVFPEVTEEDKQANRRVEIKVLK